MCCDALENILIWSAAIRSGTVLRGTVWFVDWFNPAWLLSKIYLFTRHYYINKLK